MKRKGTSDQDGKEEMVKRLKDEKAAIESFFSGGATGARKSKKKSAVKTQLAVPVATSTPAVQEREQVGLGTVMNPVTGKTKRVTRGKNATKGRGTVRGPNDTSMLIKQPPTLDEVLNYDYGEDDDDLFKAPAPTLESLSRALDEQAHQGHQATDDAGGDDDELVDTPSIVLCDNIEDAGFPKKVDDHQPVARPVYRNDCWSETSVRRLCKKPIYADGGQVTPSYFRGTRKVPDFYVRRSRNTVDFPVGEDRGARILTFHPDGTFQWPESSTHNCWNCCHPFDGPPCLIPRRFDRVLKFYQLFGNFCSWSCAKRFTLSQNDFNHHQAPVLDYFAWKYFGVQMPIPVAPPPLLLACFSEFGMSIEEYRAAGQVNHKSDFEIVHPPWVPYEVSVVWQNRPSTTTKRPKGAYAEDKKRRFEQQMRGLAPLPDMPSGISEDTKTISDIVPGTFVPSSKKKQKKKNLLTLLKK